MKKENDINISKMAKDIAANLKILGYIPPSANFEHKVRLTKDEIKFIAEQTGLDQSEIYYKFG